MIQKETRRQFPYSFALKLLAFIVVIILVMVFELDNEERVTGDLDWMSSILHGISYFLIPSLLLSTCRFIILAIYKARHNMEVVRGNFVLGINRLTAVLNAIFLVTAIMISVGIDPVKFLTSLTFVAMAIVVLFRDYLTNMLSGFYIMFSEQFSIGDRIKAGEHKGRIMNVTFSSIELQNEEDDIVLVPNNFVFLSPIVNLSAHRSNFFTVRFELPLTVATKFEALEQDIMATLLNHPNLDASHKPVFQVLEIGKDYVRYKLELFAVNSSNRLHKQLENEVLRRILLFKGIKAE